MPRILNRRCVHGVGSTGGSLDNVLQVSRAGALAWVTTQQVVCNAPSVPGSESFVLTSFAPGGPARPYFDPDPSTGIDCGADQIAAGAGIIAAGLRPNTGAFTRLIGPNGWRRTLERFSPWDVDRMTGAAVLSVQQEGQTLHVWTKDNDSEEATYVVPTGPIGGARSLWNRLVWTEVTPQGWTLRGWDLENWKAIAIAQCEPNAYQPLLFAHPRTGRLFVLYSGQEGAVWFHPVDDPTHGHMLPPGQHFGLDGEIQPDWSLFIASCLNAGESAGSLQTLSWSLDVLESIAVPAPPLPDIAPFRFAAYAGFSWVPAGHRAPGTCQVLTPMSGEPAQDWRQMADQRPVFAEGACIALARPPQLLGQIGSHEGAGPGFDYATDPLLADYLIDCARNGTRPVFADDGEPGAYPQAILDRLPAWALPCPECYPIHGETPADTIARLDQKVFGLMDRWPYDFAVVVPVYTQQGNWQKGSVLAIATRVSAWSDAADGRLKFVWVFPRERGGPGGPLNDPDMMALGERYVAAASAAGVPMLLPVGDTPPAPVPDPGPEPDAPAEPAQPDAPEPEPKPAPVPDSGSPVPTSGTPDIAVATTVTEDIVNARLKLGSTYLGLRGSRIAGWSISTGFARDGGNVVTLIKQPDGQYAVQFVSGCYLTLTDDGHLSAHDWILGGELFQLVDLPGGRALYGVRAGGLGPVLFTVEAA